MKGQSFLEEHEGEDAEEGSLAEPEVGGVGHTPKRVQLVKEILVVEGYFSNVAKHEEGLEVMAV